MEDTLTVFTASKYCNVSSKTIINWVEAGHIKAYRTVVVSKPASRSIILSLIF